MATRLSLYINTLVFTVVAALVSLMLLVMLWSGSQLGSDYAPLIITVEIGLLLSVIVVVASVRLYELYLSRLENNVLDNILAVENCPDYWTKKGEGEGATCENTYTAPNDGSGTVVSYRMPGASPVIKLSEYNKRAMGVVCQNAVSQMSPWTDVRAACNSYNLGHAA